MKIIGALLLVCSGLLLTYGYEDVLDYFNSPPEKLQSAIQLDTSSTLKTNIETSNLKIHHVDIKYRSKAAHDFLNKYQPKFKTVENGEVWLEIEVLDLPDKHNPGIITQTSVFDLKSNNKISEFGETYYFRDFKKVSRK
ncbi:MAG: hypothetical protein EOO45_09415 [Flavobacterium sp.]|nr:MAG: hypothetical protein EOO45_09415 [Flavobacterium sp.]